MIEQQRGAPEMRLGVIAGRARRDRACRRSPWPAGFAPLRRRFGFAGARRFAGCARASPASAARCRLRLAAAGVAAEAARRTVAGAAAALSALPRERGAAGSDRRRAGPARRGGAGFSRRDARALRSAATKARSVASGLRGRSWMATHPIQASAAVSKHDQHAPEPFARRPAWRPARLHRRQRPARCRAPGAGRGPAASC